MDMDTSLSYTSTTDTFTSSDMDTSPPSSTSILQAVDKAICSDTSRLMMAQNKANLWFWCFFSVVILGVIIVCIIGLKKFVNTHLQRNNSQANSQIPGNLEMVNV